MMSNVARMPVPPPATIGPFRSAAARDACAAAWGESTDDEEDDNFQVEDNLKEDEPEDDGTGAEDEIEEHVPSRTSRNR
jgi:hypothetical protein